MILIRKFARVGSHFGNDGHSGNNVDAVNRSQVRTADPHQFLGQVHGRGVGPLFACFPGLGLEWFGPRGHFRLFQNPALQAGQINPQLVVTLPDLPMRELIAVHRLLQFK